MRTTATKTIKPPPSHPPKSALRRNYEDLQLKYIRLVHILCQIKEAVGHDGPVNDLPGIVRELKIAGVAQIEPAKAERAGSGPAPGDQDKWISAYLHQREIFANEEERFYRLKAIAHSRAKPIGKLRPAKLKDLKEDAIFWYEMAPSKYALVLVSEVYGSGSFTDSMGNNYHIGEGFFVEVRNDRKRNR